MKDEQTRYKHYMPDYCMMGAKTGPQTIVVRQVLGEKEQQKVLDIHVRVPEYKPAIEQIIDVFVKNVTVNSVDVIADKVIVRGEFEVKTIYVACLPGNPVHALEMKHCKWTQDVDMMGARRGMDAEAAVLVTFVDYDVAEMTRAYKYKYHGTYDSCDTSEHCSCDTTDTCDTHDSCECKPKCDYPPQHHPMPPFKPPMGGGGMNPCPPMMPPCPPMASPCPPACPPPKPPKPPKPEMPPCPPMSCEEICCREFDVSVILRITAKVLTDREVQLSPKTGGAVSGASAALPEKPKG